MEPSERLKQVEMRLAKLEAILLGEFRKSDSSEALRQQSRAAIQLVDDVEAKYPYRPAQESRSR